MKIFGKDIKIGNKAVDKTSCANHLTGYKYNMIKRNAALYGIDLNDKNAKVCLQRKDGHKKR